MPCDAWAVRGGTVCVAHGGAAPQVRQKARERLAEAAIGRALAEFDPTPVDDPVAELAAVAGRVKAWMDLAESKVRELETLTVTGDAGEGIEHARSAVAIYERALDRTANVLGLLVKLDLGARLVRVEEIKAEAVVRLIVGALTRAGFDPDSALIGACVEAELAALPVGESLLR